MKINDLTFTAIRACVAAGKEINEVYNSDFNVEYKNDQSPLTLADKKSNEIIEEFLQKTKISIISEEGINLHYDLRKNKNLLWLVDPLDGTKEFIKKNGEFTVNIALLENNTPVIGVIYVPCSRTLYFSNKKIGSYKLILQETEKIESIKYIISLSKKLPIKKEKKIPYVIVCSRSHMNELTEKFISKKKDAYKIVKTISAGSSIKICLVAEGVADVYPRLAPTMEWDIAAGHAIAKFAGFNVKSIVDGKEMSYNKKNLLNSSFVVE